MQKINTDEFNFEYMKKAICEQSESEQLFQEEYCRRIAKAFKTDTFDELLTRTKLQVYQFIISINFIIIIIFKNSE